MRRAIVMLCIPVALLLSACEVPNGTNYGWVADANGDHATCGAERMINDGAPWGQSFTWKEPSATSICNYESQFQVGPGQLGDSIVMRRNGVICAQKGFSYNAYATHLINNSVTCPDFATNDNYYATVSHRWWSTVRSIYAGVTRDTPTISS